MVARRCGAVTAFLAAIVIVAAAETAVAMPPYQGLAERLVGPGQGVYAHAEDGTVLVAVAADRAVHPASVSKIPTTFSLLTRLGPDHRFVTRLRTDRPAVDGTLVGPLVVEASGDPTLVAEHAAAMASILRTRGIRRVTGGMRVTGRLLFDWKPDPSGTAFRRALAGPFDAAVLQRAATFTDAVDAGVSVTGRLLGEASNGSPILEHRSAPLLAIVKALNSYSNNVFHQLAEEVGGVRVVESDARAAVPPAWSGEIRLDNGAGAGTTNRLSPRATVAIIDALAEALRARGLDLTDVLPVAGRDVGTLQARLDDPDARSAVVGKTGTYGSLGACALAGVIWTQRWGRVTFAILNRDVPVPEARRRQDAFVRAVLTDAGVKHFTYEPPRTPVVLAAEVR